MKKIFFSKAVTHESLRFFCMTLLSGVLLFSFGFIQAKAENLLKNPHGVEKCDKGSVKYGMTRTKDGGLKIIAHNPAGETVKMRVGFYDYERSDSVFVIRKKNDCWYCFSQKSGVISEPYINMGTPSTTLDGKQLIACVNEKCKLGFLDCHTGKEVIPCQFYYNADIYDEDYSFGYNSPCFDGNTCLLQMLIDKDVVEDCIIDINGKVVLGGFYDISKTDYFNGYIVQKEFGKKMSLYTKDLQCVLSDKEDISDYKVGILYSDSLGAISMLLDHELTKTTPVYTLFDVGECETLRGERKSEESEGSAEYYTFDIDYRLGAGVIDRDMNLVIDPNWKWDRVVPIGNGYFICYSDYTGFLMDSYGNFVVPKTRKSSSTNR